MKILLVHNYYRNKLVGGENLVFERERIFLSEHLGTENVLTYSTSSENLNPIFLLFNSFFSVAHFFKIYKKIKKNKIEIVHCHNFWPLLSFSIFLAAKMGKAKTILTLHNYRLWCLSSIFFREKRICHDCMHKRFALPGIKHKCYHNSYLESLLIAVAFFFYKQIIGISHIDYFFVLTDFQRKLIILNNLLPEKRLFLKPNFLEANSILAKNNSIKLYDFIFIGKLDESKGILQIIDSFADQKYSLLIIGDGVLSDFITKEKSSKITYMPRVINSEINGFIRSSRFLIQPSLLYETFGLTIIEAMMVGVPVLGFPIGTRKELVKDGYSGFIMDVTCPEITITKAMSLSNSEYELMSKNCKKSTEKFKASEVIKKQISIYRTIIDS